MYYHIFIIIRMKTRYWRVMSHDAMLPSPGDDPASQLEAAACITNLAAGAVSPQLTGLVGGYLVTLSASGSHLLQVSSAITRLTTPSKMRALSGVSKLFTVITQERLGRPCSDWVCAYA